MKLDGDLQASAQTQIRERWFSWPNTALLLPIPTVTALLARAVWRSLNSATPPSFGPFLGTVGLFLISYLGIAISLWPMIVPYRYTLWEPASPPKTQAFLLVGTLLLLPIILLYTSWSYWVFRRKVRADLAYH